MQKSLPVEAIVDRLGHKERTLKNAGAFAEAAGLRDAVVIVLRMADEEIKAPDDESSE
jgi:hypothetical protein